MADRKENYYWDLLRVKGLTSFQTKQKRRIKARWIIKVVAKTKLQIKSFFRNKQTRKQNKGEQKTQTNVVQDPD